jgi:hypothetical protein
VLKALVAIIRIVRKSALSGSETLTELNEGIKAIERQSREEDGNGGYTAGW